MNWLEIAAIAMLFLGIGAGGFLVAQRPTFWWGLLTVAIRAAMPVILKRMPPEQEQAMRDCYRRGGVWDNVKKRCRQGK
jgi:hypothetical protein